MRELNFSPHEIKDIIFRKKKKILNIAVFLLVVSNILILVHISQGLYDVNLKYKISSKLQSKVIDDSSKEKNDVLKFFQENILGHFSFEVADLKESTLSMKIIIKDKNEFSQCVKDLEKIKKCEMQYLTAPYEENKMLKFEVGLEVKNCD